MTARCATYSVTVLPPNKRKPEQNLALTTPRPPRLLAPLCCVLGSDRNLTERMLRARCGLRKALASETRSTKTARRAHSTLHNEQVIRSDARSQDLSPAHSKEFEKHIRAYIRVSEFYAALVQ